MPVLPWHGQSHHRGPAREVPAWLGLSVGHGLSFPRDAHATESRKNKNQAGVGLCPARSKLTPGAGPSAGDISWIPLSGGHAARLPVQAARSRHKSRCRPPGSLVAQGAAQTPPSYLPKRPGVIWEAEAGVCSCRGLEPHPMPRGQEEIPRCRRFSRGGRFAPMGSRR